MIDIEMFGLELKLPFLKRKFSLGCFFLLHTMCSLSALSAEFHISDTFPIISGVGFTEETVGFSADGRRFLPGTENRKVYFIYERGSQEVHEVAEAEFHEHFPGGAVLTGPRPDPEHEYDLIGEAYSGDSYALDLGYCGEGVVEAVENVWVNDRLIRIAKDEQCTNAMSLEVVDDQLWIGTTVPSEGGYMRAEGIIVQSLESSGMLGRIDSLSGAVSRIHFDPVSRNIWAVTMFGFYQISRDFNVISSHLFYHGFNPETGEPKILFSEKGVSSDPFSVLSRFLSEEDRAGFYEVVAEIPETDKDEFSLYDFYMCCNFHASKYPSSFKPLIPFFLRASAGGDDIFDNRWRQALCRLGASEARDYCHRAD